MTARRNLAPLGAAMLACLSACARSGAPEPPALAYGAQECAGCGMIITDNRFAAAIVFGDSSHDGAVFDDLGCLLVFEQQHSDRPVAARFIRHADGSRWLPAGIATYLQSAELHSPMGFGIAAYASSAEAGAARSEHGGEVLDFAQLQRRVTSVSLRSVNSEGIHP